MPERDPQHLLHPQPQRTRAIWRSLDGLWDFAYDDAGRYRHPAEVPFDRRITVPFPPESPASGIADPGFHPTVWYRTRFRLRPEERAHRLLLHFGAVDYQATVWCNGQHTTGIWQTVWIEPVPETYLARVRWTPLLEHWEIGLEALIEGPLQPGNELRLRLHGPAGELLADDRYALTHAELSRSIALPDPGIDDYRNRLLWSPENPVLIEADLELWQRGACIDRVHSYTALRSVGAEGCRFLLNGRPYYLRMVLDQGYWPETLLAPPSPEALRRDVELTKQLGFNAVRKHQKLEDPRWLYFCDRMGLLVWVEMPSPYRFTCDAVERLVSEWTDAVQRDFSHPCVAAWVPLNESWGVPDLPTNPAHCDYVRALYFLTKTLDPTRPVVGNDGWEHVATDFITIHDYAAHPGVLHARYETPESVAKVLERQQPGGRPLTVAGFRVGGMPVILSEFGGIACFPPGEGGWGYSRAEGSSDLLAAYSDLLEAVHDCSGLAGFCYTQLTDTFQERNGLLFADRTPKVDLEQLARATRGRRSAFAMDVNPDLPSLDPKRWRRPSPRGAGGAP